VATLTAERLVLLVASSAGDGWVPL
jgi:hypothetical protein